MKIKNRILQKRRPEFLGIKLLKTQAYRNTANLKIEDTEYRIKKALHVIYKYHKHNKRILFVGTPSNAHKEIKQLLKETKHVLISESIWTNGCITNQDASFDPLLKSQNPADKIRAEIIFQLRKKSDLIVILNVLKNRDALKEGYLSKTPIISLGCELNVLEKKSTYKVPVKFNFTNKKIGNSFFYGILKIILKKAKLDNLTANQRRHSVFKINFFNSNTKQMSDKPPTTQLLEKILATDIKNASF
jgi:hypothetical protein|uniref:Ribosomal protein S2 n=1 Tax=Phaeodactylum tricornutum TaxID=2850 RepID=F1DGN6_PHATR|nr:ribosomal protein S2 [Phaeodactylum tricornutum]ADY18514.1 ribosomal protein S2 [Phaeodactylum tricornutum]